MSSRPRNTPALHQTQEIEHVGVSNNWYSNQSEYCSIPIDSNIFIRVNLPLVPCPNINLNIVLIQILMIRISKEPKYLHH